MSEELLRPTLSADICDERLIPLLKACWSENPEHRPPFTNIRRSLRKAIPERYKNSRQNVSYLCPVILKLINALHFHLHWTVLSMFQSCQHPGQHGQQT